ncbi:MAG TPA: MFS transporter [Chloroflexota bacterium]|nr:MFS transporter [Chloroflexota bacterium]
MSHLRQAGIDTANYPATGSVRLGLRANWPQFALLVLVNAFVGGMVGLERTVVPLIGAEEFQLASTTLVTSFIVSFGIVKACANLVAGQLADMYGRKRVLVLGWLVGLPVPFLIMLAPSWDWIVVANALLGINQGLAWSMTVLMKIDLVGPSRRGLAMGLNEAAGYGAVGLTALATGYLAALYGLRPQPFYLGVVYAVLGLALSLLWVRETRDHALHEARQAAAASAEARPAEPAAPAQLGFRQVFWLTSWRQRTLFAVSQAGLVNNLNDGMSWGIFPLFFAAHAVGLEGIGLIKAIYPVVWGVGQLVTGYLSDRWGRKGLIVGGMWVQALALAIIGGGVGLLGLPPLAVGLAGSVLLGAGTAMVYPALLAAVGDAAHPAWRARALSVYRFWRDMGYAVGALASGLIADALGLTWAIVAVAGLTLLSGIVAQRTMQEPLRRRPAPRPT